MPRKGSKSPLQGQKGNAAKAAPKGGKKNAVPENEPTEGDSQAPIKKDQDATDGSQPRVSRKQRHHAEVGGVKRHDAQKEHNLKRRQEEKEKYEEHETDNKKSPKKKTKKEE